MSALKAALVSFLISFSLGGFAIAQEAAKKNPAAPTTVRIVFEGGTLEAYVDTLRKQFPNSNIVTDGVGTVEVQKVILQRVTLRSALEWIPRTSEARNKHVVLQPPVAGREGDVVFVLTTTHIPVRAVATSDDRQVRTYNLNEEVRPGVKPDQVTRLVQTTLKERRGEEFKGSVKYDPPTHILTVVGTSEDLRAADQVVEEITRGQRIAAVLPRLQAEMKTLRDRLDKLDSQVSEARKSSAK